MAHRTYQKWLFGDRLYIQVKVADELWYNRLVGSDDCHDYREYKLFSIGWLTRADLSAKLFNVTILTLVFKIALHCKPATKL